MPAEYHTFAGKSMMTERRRDRAMAAAFGCGDVLAGEWARLITGGPLYWIKSITKGKDGELYALAWDTSRPGHNDIIAVSLLIQAEDEE